MWERAYEQTEDKLTAQRVVMQQLTGQCCMLENRLQHLEDGHNGARSAPSFLIKMSTCCVTPDLLVKHRLRSHSNSRYFFLNNRRVLGPLTDGPTIQGNREGRSRVFG